LLRRAICSERVQRHSPMIPGLNHTLHRAALPSNQPQSLVFRQDTESLVSAM
jgi:hypothetical protein